MARSTMLDIDRAMRIIDGGGAQELDGRGVNRSFLLIAYGQEFAVKVHCDDESSDQHLQRIGRVDALLRGACWYPPIVDAGLHGRARRRLVVVRPFAQGQPLNQLRLDAAPVVAILAELTSRGDGLDVGDELIEDFATPWLSSGAIDGGLAGHVTGTEFGDLARTVDACCERLIASAVAMTRTDRAVPYHGDLHGGNMIVGSHGRLTVVDWDQAGFSRRPADAAKALWLNCRRERGHFALDARAVRGFLRFANKRLGLSYAVATDLANLGAIWFIPTARHITLLGRRRSDLAVPYLRWSSRFWERFSANLDLIAAEAARLAARTGG